MFVIYKVYTSTTPLHTTPHKVKNFQSEKENQYLDGLPNTVHDVEKVWIV